MLRILLLACMLLPASLGASEGDAPGKRAITPTQSGQLAGAQQAFCDSWPDYPKIGASEVSSSRLVFLFLEHADPGYVEVARSSASDVERALATRPNRDVEDAFYQSQLRRLEALCPQDGSGWAAAPGVIEMQASALASAADLQDATDEVVQRVVPSRLTNLTAASNVLVLAAACSRRDHPRLAGVLARRGLVCSE